MILLRTTEVPKYNKTYIASRFPGYTIVGVREGWFYPIEETKVILVSSGWRSLVDEVRSHMKGNNIPVPPNLSEIMQDWWCKNVSDFNCGEKPVPGARDLTALAERFLRTAKSFIFNGGQKVPQEEAERRAAICATCEFNSMDGSFCSGCFLRSLTASAVSMVSGWKTSQDDKLGYCLKCGCKNQLKVFVNREDMDHKDLKDAWPEHCWMKSDANGTKE
jgi:hypothetical protein